MKFEIYRDANQQWRWRLKARNGKIVANSGEAFSKFLFAERIVKKLQAGLSQARVVIAPPDGPAPPRTARSAGPQPGGTRR